MARTPHEVTVARRDQLTPNLMRMTLAGESLADFPAGFEGGYIKLTFPAEGGRKVVRSYTVRRFDAEEHELVIDMVAHGDTGPAATWANHVQVGERITIEGPGPCRRLNAAADWFLIAGDMSALPAISVNLEVLRDDAIGHAVLEIIDPADRLELDMPPGIDLTWIVNPKPEVRNSLLEDAVVALPWLEGRASVWVAGEYASSRALRRYFRDDRPVERDSIYVSCYWKIGETDEGMKAAKRTDSEQW